MDEVTCANCFRGDQDPEHVLLNHPRRDNGSRPCTVIGCDCLGWTPRAPMVRMTYSQAHRLRVLSHNAEQLVIRPKTFDLPDGYITVDVTYGPGRVVTYGVAADGRASS